MNIKIIPSYPVQLFSLYRFINIHNGRKYTNIILVLTLYYGYYKDQYLNN